MIAASALVDDATLERRAQSRPMALPLTQSTAPEVMTTVGPAVCLVAPAVFFTRLVQQWPRRCAYANGRQRRAALPRVTPIRRRSAPSLVLSLARLQAADRVPCPPPFAGAAGVGDEADELPGPCCRTSECRTWALIPAAGQRCNAPGHRPTIESRDGRGAGGRCASVPRHRRRCTPSAATGWAIVRYFFLRHLTFIAKRIH